MERVTSVHNLLVIANDGTTFAGREVFGVLKTETAQVAKSSALLVSVFRLPRLAGIFYYHKVMLFCNGIDSVHIGR